MQQALSKAILALNKPTVVFLLNAGAVEIDAIAHRAAIPSAPLAIIEAMWPGPHGAQALAEGIMGEMNSWGRLPFTIYNSNFTRQAEMAQHDLRVSPGRTYRYNRDATYFFGSGLSLSNWTLNASAPSCLSTLSTSTPNKGCLISLELRNDGPLDGDSVILAYFRAKRTAAQWRYRRTRNAAGRADADLLTPLKQLFDFHRVNNVSVGGTRLVQFNVTASSLSEVDEASGDRVSEAAEYELIFDDGGGRMATAAASVTGERRVLEPFPSSSPSRPKSDEAW